MEVYRRHPATSSRLTLTLPPPQVLPRIVPAGDARLSLRGGRGAALEHTPARHREAAAARLRAAAVPRRLPRSGGAVRPPGLALGVAVHPRPRGPGLAIYDSGQMRYMGGQRRFFKTKIPWQNIRDARARAHSSVFATAVLVWGLRIFLGRPAFGRNDARHVAMSKSPSWAQGRTSTLCRS